MTGKPAKAMNGDTAGGMRLPYRPPIRTAILPFPVGWASGDLFERPADGVEDLVDLRLLDDERGR